MDFSYLQVLLKKYSKLALTVTLFVTLLALLGSVVMRVVHPTFVSSCLILVYPSEEDRALLKEASIFGARQDVESTTLSKTQILLSKTVLESVAERLMATPSYQQEKPGMMERFLGAVTGAVGQTMTFLNYGPGRDMTELEEMVETLEKRVSVNIFPNSFVLEVKARASSAMASYQIVKQLSETYVEYTRSFNHDLAGESRRFIENEVSQLEQELHSAEDALRQFKENEDAPQLRTQGSDLISRESDLQAEYESITATLEELRAERRGLLQQMESVDREVSSRMVELNPMLQQLRLDLANKEIELASLLEVYTIEHQEAKAVESSIATLRETLAKEMEKILTREEFSTNPVYTDLANRLVRVETLLISQEARMVAVEDVLTGYDELLAELPAKETQLTRLKREVSALSENYLFLQEKLGEARLLEVAKLYDIRIVEPPVVPVRPVAPAILINTILGMLLGFLLSIAAIILLEYVRATR